MAVMSATRRLKTLSRFSSSSSGFGNSTSATGRGGPLSDLFAHRLFAGLEGGDQPLGLLLEHLSALVEPFAGVLLSLARPLLSPLGHLAAALGQQVAGLASGARAAEVRDGRAQGRPEDEPAEVTRSLASLLTHCSLLDPCEVG